MLMRCQAKSGREQQDTGCLAAGFRVIDHPADVLARTGVADNLLSGEGRRDGVYCHLQHCPEYLAKCGMPVLSSHKSRYFHLTALCVKASNGRVQWARARVHAFVRCL